mmetsp:Transcript_80048/g.141275  ORF Transcript_80048/g.141275 Transcript_80048/m.141275 type:complete len:85 (-) Transcript_80048:349-603(-)
MFLLLPGLKHPAQFPNINLSWPRIPTRILTAVTRTDHTLALGTGPLQDSCRPSGDVCVEIQHCAIGTNEDKTRDAPLMVNIRER